jgi:hypothetical protein
MIVMPVQTGIQVPDYQPKMDCGVRRNDDGQSARLLKHGSGLRPAQRGNAIRPYVSMVMLRLRAFAGDISDCIS